MNRSDLCTALAAATSLSKADAAAAAGAIFSAIAGALARGETVTIAGFGKFTARDRPARSGRNPQTGEAVAIAASGCLSSRPARPSVTPSTHSLARAVARNPRPVVAASAAPAYAFAIGASRCTGPEDPALPYRLRLVDRWSDPPGQRPPAIRFAPSAHAPSSARRRPPRRLGQEGDVGNLAIRHAYQHMRTHVRISKPLARGCPM